MFLLCVFSYWFVCVSVGLRSKLWISIPDIFDAVVDAALLEQVAAEWTLLTTVNRRK